MEDHNYDDPSYLVNVFGKQCGNMTSEEREKLDKELSAFADWVLMDEAKKDRGE